MLNEILNINTINSINNIKNKYIEYIDASNNTVETYKNGIENFILYMNNNNISNPTRQDVINYRNELRECYSANTVNSYMTAIRGLFKYLEINDIYQNITKEIKGSTHVTTPKKQVLSLEQAKIIYSSLTDKREKALFSLLITTGIRGIECINAKIEDIKLYNNEIVLFIQCKGHNSKDEYVKLSEQTLLDIQEYTQGRQEGYIFIGNGNNNNGNGLTTKTIRLIIKNIFKRFGLDSDTFSLHSCRRSMACIAYQNGASVYDIKSVLHHRSITTTSRYLQQVERDTNKTEYNVASVLFA